MSGSAHRFHFFVDAAASDGDELQLSAADVHHLGVIRARPGTGISIAAADGSIHEAELIDPASGLVRVGARYAPSRRHQARIELCACIIESGRRWDDLVDGAVQAGVDAVIPVIDHRGDERLANRRRDRTLRVVEAAAKQSRQARMAELCEPERLDSIEPGPCGILLEPEAPHQLLRIAPEALASGPPVVRILIGSPRGIAADTVTALVERGWQPAGMGSSILRSELAAAGATLTVVQAAIDAAAVAADTSSR